MKYETGVLILTDSEDAHADIVQKRMSKRNLESHRLNIDFIATSPFTHEVLSKQAAGSCLPEVDSIRTVWYRSRNPTYSVKSDVESFLSQENDGLWSAICNRYSHARWVSSLGSLHFARSKIYQLELASRIGMIVPDSVITNQEKPLFEFAQKHGHQVVVKPIQAQIVSNSQMSYVFGTRKIDRRQYKRLLQQQVPSLIQEQLKILFEVRVVVFGQQMFAFSMSYDTATDDIKQLKLNEIHHESYSLPAQVKEQLIRMVNHFGLQFAAIDLVMCKDGRLVFLELNPNGQWLWLQHMTGENLLDPFIDFLTSVD